MTLKAKFTFLLVGSFLLVFVIMAVFFSISRDVTIQHLIRSKENEISLISLQIKNSLNNYDLDLQLLRDLPSVKLLLDARDKGDVETVEVWQEMVEKSLFSFLNVDASLLQLSLLDNSGQELIKVNKKSNELISISQDSLQSPYDTPYFQEIVKNQDKDALYVSELSFKNINNVDTLFLSYARPIFVKGGFKGVIVADIGLGGLINSFLQDSDLIDQNGVDFKILDQDGQVIAAVKADGSFNVFSRGGFDERFLNYKGQLLQAGSLSSLYRSSILDEYRLSVYALVTYNDVNHNSFLILNEDISTDVVFELPNKIFVKNLLIFLLILLGVFILAYLLFIRWFIQRISDLSMVINKIKSGDYSVRAKLVGHDEFSLIAQAINQLAINNQKYKKEQSLRAEVLRKKNQELQKANQWAEKTRGAIANLLEDVAEENKATKKALRELKKFELSIKNVSEGIIITDPQANILFINPAMEKITGYKKEEVLGKNPGELWGGHMDNKFYENMWKIIAKDKKDFRAELVNVRKNGQKYDAELVISPLLNERGDVEFFVGVQRDITERKRIERSKSDFISIASHQLRTPLSTIEWYLEMLADEEVGQLNPEQKEYVEITKENAQRLARLIKDLLNVSRIESGRLKIEVKLVDLSKLVDRGIKDLKPVFESKNCSIKFFKPKKTIPKIKTDPSLLFQVISNLLTNAVKYSNKMCNIKVRLQLTKQKVVISVTDSGMGIAESDKARIFEKFYRSDQAMQVDAEGSGLGLYIAKTIMESLGGSIWFESKENKGTTFYISLPLSGSKSKKGEVGLA